MSDTSSSKSSMLQYLCWSPERLTPRQFLEKFSLPRLVRITDAGSSPGVGSDVDLSQPLMLYRQYRSYKAQARSLKLGRSGKWKEVGPAVVIPESYTGWFSMVSEKGQTAHCYTTVEQVASAQVVYFLTRFDVPAYKLTDSKDTKGKTLYVKTTARSGQVLKLLGVFEDLNAKRSSRLSLIGRVSSGFASSSKYAQCLSQRNEVVFIHFSTAGRFYAVGPRDSRDPNHVYLLPHLLKTHRLPIKVHLVCGFLPTVPCGFTGTLLLERCQREDVVLACTVTRDRPALLEMELDSRFLLTRAMDEDHLAKAPLFQAALSFCRDQGEVWRRQIKVTHHVFPRPDLRRSRSMNDAEDGASRSSGSIRDKPRTKSFSRPNMQQRELPSIYMQSADLDDLPYCRVLDAVAEENIYAEICEPGKDYYMRLGLSGGSDGTFSGTMSSSNPSSPEDESIYDSVC